MNTYYSSIPYLDISKDKLKKWFNSDIIYFKEVYKTKTLHKVKRPQKKQIVPLWEKLTLTLEEAAEYSGIGIHKLRQLTDKNNCDFVLWNGNKRLIKRKKFDEYIDKSYSI